MDPNWKEKYISSFISISTPWAGSINIARSMISGYNFGIPIPQHTFHPIQSNCASGPWLLPIDSVFQNQPIVTTKNDSYSSKDWERLFSDLGLKQALTLYKKNNELT